MTRLAGLDRTLAAMDRTRLAVTLLPEVRGQLRTSTDKISTPSALCGERSTNRSAIERAPLLVLRHVQVEEARS